MNPKKPGPPPDTPEDLDSVSERDRLERLLDSDDDQTTRFCRRVLDEADLDTPTEENLRETNALNFLALLINSRRFVVPSKPNLPDVENYTWRLLGTPIENGKVMCIGESKVQGHNLRYQFTIEELMKENLRYLNVEQCFPVGTEVLIPVQEFRLKDRDDIEVVGEFGGRSLIKGAIAPGHQEKKVSVLAGEDNNEDTIIKYTNLKALIEYGNIPSFLTTIPTDVQPQAYPQPALLLETPPADMMSPIQRQTIKDEPDATDVLGIPLNADANLILRIKSLPPNSPEAIQLLERLFPKTLVGLRSNGKLFVGEIDHYSPRNSKNEPGHFLYVIFEDDVQKLGKFISAQEAIIQRFPYAYYPIDTEIILPDILQPKKRRRPLLSRLKSQEKEKVLTGKIYDFDEDGFYVEYEDEKGEKKYTVLTLDQLDEKNQRVVNE